MLFTILCLIPDARAATCDAGYYLKNGECTECNPSYEPYYCPGDDMRHPCPTTDTDYNQFGYTRIGGSEATWASAPAYAPERCFGSLYFRDEYGNECLKEHLFNGENYWREYGSKWYKAGSGYYLSDYHSTSAHDWYSGVKPCTNAPEHAPYTAPGTPDEPKSGGAKDANNCPWECDNGYGRHNDTCVPLCLSGIQYIKTGNGLIFNLYPIACSSPALHINYNGQVCYGVLVSGAADSAINIRHGDTVYHTVN